MTNQQANQQAPQHERLAQLRILVAIARADGDIQPWEQTLLNQLIHALHPTESVTVERLLTESVPLQESLAAIASPEAQRQTYQEALAFAKLDGITASEERLLRHIRDAFQLPPEDDIAISAPAGEPNAQEQLGSGVDEGVDWAATSVSGRGIVLGMRSLIEHSRRVRNLVLDYSLGAAIIGLIPIPGTSGLKLLAMIVLLFRMVRDIGRHWGFPRGRDLLAIAGNLFGTLGALAMTFMAWATLILLGLIFVPLRSLAPAAAYFTLTWTLGQVTNQFYLSSSRLDVAALRRASAHMRAVGRSPGFKLGKALTQRWQFRRTIPPVANTRSDVPIEEQSPMNQDGGTPRP